MAFKTASPVDAANCLRDALCISAGCSLLDAKYELLRTTVWNFGSPEKPIHVAKVLNASIPLWRLIRGRSADAQDDLRAELREALGQLSDSGDLVELSGGRWTPAATRTVQLHTSANYLLVGGVPLSTLPIALRDVRHHGPYRHVSQVDGLKELCPQERYVDWARLPDRSLQEWSRELLESVALSPYVPTSQDPYEFYLPDKARKRTPQFKRWVRDPGSIKGQILVRRTRLYAAREYRIVELNAGKITRSAEIQKSDARRLMYALDAEAGNPVLCRYITHKGDTNEIVLTSELPRPEQRVFAAFGVLEIPSDRRFERRWHFCQPHDLALTLLRSLNIEISTSSGKAFR